MAESLAVLVGEDGAIYPEFRGVFAEGVIRQLREEIVFGDQDVVTYCNGCIESIDIKTPETAEVLFECIRNCVQIIDLTDVCLEPMALPIEINGCGTGTFEMFFATYRETGQFIGISFSREDSERLIDLCYGLCYNEHDLIAEQAALNGYKCRVRK